MIRLECDYGEGAHPKILEALTQTNLEQTAGYGMDPHCDHARELIRQACQAPEAAVEFLVGGTQANATVIAAILRPYQGALCAQTGHINVHETGAIEASGHKVLPLPAKEGKITAQEIRRACRDHWEDATHEHIVQPGLVYLSQPTEEGTLYTRSELEDIRAACDEYHLPLYIDGARCGYGLGAALGAKLGNPNRPVINIAGDGSFHMNCNELFTAAKYNIPVIELIFNNAVLGMVRQWQKLFYGHRFSQTDLEKSTNYELLAEAFGVKALTIRTPEDITPVLHEALSFEGPVLINCIIDKDLNVLPMVPAGASAEDPILTMDD